MIVRVEVRPALDHQLEDFVGEPVAVLDRRAAGEHRSFRALRTLRVDDRTLPQRICFIARGADLIVGHRLRSAFADAGSGENLHEVGAVGNRLPDERADLRGIAGLIGDCSQRREDARTGNSALGDPVAQVLVQLRARALDRRESGHERLVGVFGRVQHGLLRCLVDLTAVNLVRLAIEMRGDVRVRVDPAGHHRHATEIVGGGRDIRVDAGDATAFDDDRDVPEDGALSIQNGRRANDDRARLALSGNEGRHEHRCQDERSRNTHLSGA